jgi:hypothetical protein
VWAAGLSADKADSPSRRLGNSANQAGMGSAHSVSIECVRKKYGDAHQHHHRNRHFHHRFASRGIPESELRRNCR